MKSRVSHRGKTIYITDLEDLVSENYTRDEINRVIKSGKEFVCICPLCKLRHKSDYSNRKLYITRDYSVGHCFVCDNTFQNINYNESKSVNNPDNFDITLDIGSDGLSLPELDLSLLDILHSASSNPDSVNYLHNRNPYLNPDKYDLRYTRNKLVIPFRYSNNIIYYQIRFLDPTNPRMKYYTPGNSIKPFYIASDHWDSDRPTILTEGVFSAIGVDCTGIDANVIALLGNTITDYQFNLLAYLGYTDIYCYLDKYELSNKLAQTLKCNHNVNSRLIPPVTYGSELDQEEELNRIGPDMLLKHITEAINYTRPTVQKDSLTLEFEL